jgi:hypothetical protein
LTYWWRNYLRSTNIICLITTLPRARIRSRQAYAVDCITGLLAVTELAIVTVSVSGTFRGYADIVDLVTGFARLTWISSWLAVIDGIAGLCAVTELSVVT